MKKSLALVVAGLMAVLATTASAGNKEGTFSLSPVIGGYTYDGVQHLDTAPVVGARLGYNFTKAFGVEGLFDYAHTESTQSENKFDMYRYGGELLYHFFPDNTLVPYVAAGYAGLNFNDYKPKGAFDYGAGVKYFLTDNFALRGDVRHILFKSGGSDSKTLNNVEYTIGAYIPFGGTAPVVKAVEAPAAPEPVVAPAPAPEEAPLEEIPAAEPTPGHYKYCVTLHIEFDIDKTAIRPEYHDEVAKVGDFMKKYPATTAVIEGHTDNVGTPEHNLDLSRRRAENIVNYLVEKFGIERSRLTAKGYGSTRPVADNATEEGKQKNRRIEAIIDCAFDVKEVHPPERLCMSLQMEFDTGKADIKPMYHDEIAKVGEYMKKYPTTTAVIEGHTDNVGGYEYNMKLSRERAENVVNYLVENFGIDRSRLTAKGYGYTRRIAYNNTAEGRQKNRRIDAVIDCVIKK
ncbi:OmpA family protein [Geobacter sp. AOG2]|uniref:OmpA family protein n=1 Tax=Geobacter sp. AOG2 TaxID=1566347 RepID=UPI001CC827DD|nr:OmpA family protein [Geobacter sp. AOG2]GFE62608.1 membrane protein [Geobacter sp. AOG2]